MTRNDHEKQFRTFTLVSSLKVSLLHIIFIIPMNINDVSLSVAFRGVSGLNFRRKKGEELLLREEVVFSFVKTVLRMISVGCTICMV
jgi:hypothetical protein